MLKTNLTIWAVVVLAARVALGQVGFRPATELVAVEPPPDVVPMNAGQVILGLADHYVYQFGSFQASRIRVTQDFSSFTELALPDGNTLSSDLMGVSDDGRRVIGRVSYQTAGKSRAVEWFDAGAPIVHAVGGGLNQRPLQASADASHWALAVGLSAFEVVSYLAGLQDFKPVVLFPEDGTIAVYATAISPDGLTVAGQYNGNNGQVFTWTQAGGGVLLPLSASNATPIFVSNGGSRVVTGQIEPGGGTALQTLGASGWRSFLPMRMSSMSRDGRMLLGWTASGITAAKIWTETLGTEDLGAALRARGIDLRGWTLREARYISADNRVIVGRGTAPGSNVLRWWVATIEPLATADIGKAGGVGGSDGELDNNDFIVFIHRFFAQDERADVGKAGGERGGDGAFDNNDFCAFISLFFNGEP